MQRSKVSVLSTRLLADELIAGAAVKNISIDVIPFIRTQPIQSVEVQQEIESALMTTATVVFTSVNAVEAVARELEVQHRVAIPWQIFCIGHATRKAVQQDFGPNLIAGVADDAKQLANLIIDNTDTGEVIFFCGDQRRNELPGLLAENNIEVNEIIVYQTVAIPTVVQKKYDGVLFFSPSAVKSFFQMNSVADHTILFAIGNTTANEIKHFSGNKLVVSNHPDKESIVNELIVYFETNRIHD